MRQRYRPATTRRLHRWLARPEVGAGFDVTPLWDHGDMSKAHEIVRTGMRLAEFFRRFPDDRAAEVWFVSRRWPSGPVCPHCGGGRVSEVASRRPMPYRCRECRKHFSVMSHTLMHASKLGAQTWLLAIFLIVANPKGRSSVQLAADLGVTQKTAWHLAHRIRQALAEGGLPGFDGPVEADETYIGGKARNRHAHKADPGKTAVIGVKDRRTGTVAATPVHEVTTATATAMVAATTRQGAEVYTDGSRIYDPLAAMGFNHARVIHGLGEYVRGSVSTNGVENYWSLLKRTYIGTYHYMSDNHLHRYIEEHSFRYNRRNRHVIDKMSEAAAAMEGSVADLPGVDRLPRLTRSVGDMTDPEPTAEQPLVTVEQLERATDALLAAAPKSSTEGSGVGGGVPSPNPPLGG